METGRHVKNNACAVEIKIKWIKRKQMTHENTYRDDIHTALLIYPYGPGKIFIRPCHTDQLDYLIKVLRTGCFCIGPGIDSRSAVLTLGPRGQYC